MFPEDVVDKRNGLVLELDEEGVGGWIFFFLVGGDELVLVADLLDGGEFGGVSGCTCDDCTSDGFG